MRRSSSPKTSRSRGRSQSRLSAALQAFLRTEAAGGTVLLVAAATALLWANSPWAASYQRVWEATVSGHSLRDWINDGLMTLFFFVVGLEIKRELVTGELREWRRAAFPVIAAAGGMVVPAVIYLSFNTTGEAARGWGIPMATDIAFAVGLLTLLGSRISPSLRLFVLAVAIADDIGAILVIALFYTSQVNLASLGAAAVLVLLLARIRSLMPPWVFGLVAIAVWITTFESGIHPTIAGVAIAFTLPGEPQSKERLRWAGGIENRLHPWSSFCVLPLFALANAGVRIAGAGNALTSRVAIGVALGLVVGKALGITAFAWLATRLRVATLPSNVMWRDLLAGGLVAGIGFTVSLFVIELAFTDARLIAEAKLGVLIGSAVAAAAGAGLALSRPAVPADSD